MPGSYLPNEDEFDPSTDDFIQPCLSKERGYLHFDRPLSEADRTISIDFSHEISPHRFLPLLGFTDKVRKFKIDKATGEARQTIKPRQIRFASHSDAAYLEAYSSFLNGYYEAALANDRTSKSVLAYRKGGSTNVHHAKNLFDEIRKRRSCSVIALDISGFFDCLDHQHLRQELADLLSIAYLDGHHGRVYKNITRYAWVETTDLNVILGRKRRQMGTICSPREFEQHVQGRKNGLIQTHDFPFGIPQGTPVSGLYANIYLRTFDREISSLITGLGGSYRRYSDDIALVLPSEVDRDEVLFTVEKYLASYSLSISEKKTEIASFENGLLASAKPIQYLGFTFDGTETLIRASSLDAYRSKMRRGIHAKLVAAKMKGVASPFVYRREALSRYTHLGKRRNFLRYAYKASDILEAPEIRTQVKGHVTWFNRAWEKEVVRVYGGLVSFAS